ncbi:hypothetical protein [Sphingomonas sp.]|uniref:hypothetical protein n=1 Tax=Sphingomonas sp. TaxID=28214 RepID=UPI002FC7A336
MRGIILFALTAALAACGESEESAPAPIDTSRQLTLLNFTGENGKPNCRFIGTFQNTGRLPIESGQVTIDILNNGGRSLGAHSALLDVRPLPVGATSSFTSDVTCQKGKLTGSGVDSANASAINVIM